MRAYLCDWCGKAYTPGPITAYGGSLASDLKLRASVEIVKQPVEAPFGTEAVHMGWKVESSAFREMESGGTVNDICPECANALRDFIKLRKAKTANLNFSETY